MHRKVRTIQTSIAAILATTSAATLSTTAATTSAALVIKVRTLSRSLSCEHKERVSTLSNVVTESEDDIIRKSR